MQSFTAIKFLLLLASAGLVSQAHAAARSASSSLTHPLHEHKENKTSGVYHAPTLQEKIDVLQAQFDSQEKRTDTLQQQIATLSARINSQAMEIRALNVNTTYVTMDPKYYAQWRNSVQLRLLLIGFLSVAVYSVLFK